MEKFSKLKPHKETSKKDDILYANDYMQVIEYEDWTIIKEGDLVVCIPYLIESNQIVLRYEYIPTFKYVDGQENHITLISGTIEKGETPERAVLRELEEEAGIVLRDDYKIEFMKPLFKSKGHVDKYHPCLINLTENDYNLVVAKGDGSTAEMMSKSVNVDVKNIGILNTSDLITDYMLMKVKEYLNI